MVKFKFGFINYHQLYYNLKQNVSNIIAFRAVKYSSLQN